MKNKINNKYVMINSLIINGVKNPLLTITGKIKVKDSSFEVLVDGKQLPYTIDVNSFNRNFILTLKFDSEVKNIDIYIKAKKERVLVTSIKNSKVKRVKQKLKSIFKKISSKKGIRNIVYIFETLGKGIKLSWREYRFLIPPRLWKKYFRAFKEKFRYGFDKPYYNPFNENEYNLWLKENQAEEDIEELDYNPLISIVIPVYNIGYEFLKDCINSILDQSYSNFEVCLADDHSSEEKTRDYLRELAAKDNRIKIVYRKENGGISKATNSAIKIAKGEYIAFMDDDDVLDSNALYENVKAINEDRNIDFIYSDEDKMEMNGILCEPHFKPDFSPDSLLGGNYICHFNVIKRSLLDEVGLLSSDYDGAQDFDFVLRATEKAKKICHIPKILYHWRKVPGSTAVTIESKTYAINSGKRAVEDALKRRHLKGKVSVPIKSAHYIVTYETIGNPLISIIIPTKDQAKILNKCLESIYEKTTYKNYEVIIMNNNSKRKETFELFDKYKKKYKNFKVIDANYPFNYSKINNEAVKKCKGEYLCLLNNDTEVITPEWLTYMLGYAMQKHIGAVGAKLLYPDGTIQHGGVILGIGGVAAHAYPNVNSDNFGAYGRLLVPYDYSAVTAACLVVEKKKYKEVNGFDEKLAVAYNDIDFNIKLLKKGYYNVFVPMAELYHYESKTRGDDLKNKDKYERLLRETKYMKDKWGEELLNDRFYNPNFSLKRDFVVDKKV